MEFKGTKGKWHITRYYEELKSFLLLDDNNEQIALIDYEYIRNKDIVKANALLISKAPEMLEILQQIIKEYDLGIVKGIDALKVRELIKQATEL